MTKFLILSANPVTKINNLGDTLLTSFETLAYTIFSIGFIFCALMVWKGSEENVPRFQKGMVFTGLAVAVVALIDVTISFIKTQVG